MSWKDIENEIIHDMKIATINKVEGCYEVWMDDDLEYPDHFPSKFKVKVLEGTDGRFTGIINYKIQSPGQAEPYSSMDPQDTVEKAIRDALSGLLMFLPKDAEKRKNTKLIPVEDF